jgi:hypothetical protein
MNDRVQPRRIFLTMAQFFSFQLYVSDALSSPSLRLA